MNTKVMLNKLAKRFPKRYAKMWHDYVGLMTGKLPSEVHKILLCLDCDETIYPIIAGQIGVGCCGRENKHMFKEEFERKLVIALPTIAATSSWDKDSYFLGLLDKINSSAILSSMPSMHIRFDEICQYSTESSQGDKSETRGIAKVQDAMIELEKEMVARLVKKGCLNGDSYLVKDGSLEYKEMKAGKEDFRTLRKIKNNYKWVIGVSKSFNPESLLAPHNKSNASRIADLPAFCRTPVAIYSNNYIGEGIRFGVWYLRIRDIKHTSEPFSGIVKVEKLLMDEEFDTGLDTDTVNLISANLINERTPTCYGTDTRWANHIYPVYLTETFVKSQYIGTETFLHLF